MHWKDHLDSSLLGAYSLFDDATEGWREVDGTILRCCKEEHILGGSGKKKIYVAHTSMGKPMKLNVAISEKIEEITGSKNPDKWINVPVTFWVDTKVKFGTKMVDAIRIKAQVSAPKNDWTEQIEHLKTLKTVQELQDAYFALPELAKPDLSAFIQTLVDAINTKKP